MNPCLAYLHLLTEFFLSRQGLQVPISSSPDDKDCRSPFLWGTKGLDCGSLAQFTFPRMNKLFFLFFFSNVKKLANCLRHTQIKTSKDRVDPLLTPNCYQQR